MGKPSNYTQRTLISGVYALRDQVNGVVYVGASRNIDTRWSFHRSTFRRHLANPRLQAAWDSGRIEFIVLEETVPEVAVLNMAEQRWIEHFRTRGEPIQNSRWYQPLPQSYVAPLIHLKEFRERAALSQADLAKRAGVARTTVIRLEAGEPNVMPSTLRKLARALRVKPAKLFTD